MALPSNPQTLATYDITQSDQAKIFVKKVADLFQALSTAIGLSGILNGSNLLSSAALADSVNDLGVITTDQTVAVAGGQFVFVRLSSGVGQTRTLTLSNLPQSAIVMINVNVTAGALTLKLAATDTNANVYTIQAWTSSTLSIINLVTGTTATGPIEYILYGMAGFAGTSASPRLNMIFS